MIPQCYTAISEHGITHTYSNGVRQVVRSTSDDSIYGGVVQMDGQRNGIRFEGTEGCLGAIAPIFRPATRN